MKLTCGTLSDWVLRECWLAPWYQWMAVHKGSFWSIELTLICRTGIVFCKSKECLYSPASNPNDYTRYLFQSQVTQPFTERHPGVTLTVLGWWSWMVQICRSIILMVRGPERLQLATKSTTVWSILIEQVFIAVNGLFVFFCFWELCLSLWCLKKFTSYPHIYWEALICPSARDRHLQDHDLDFC